MDPSEGKYRDRVKDLIYGDKKDAQERARALMDHPDFKSLIPGLRNTVLRIAAAEIVGKTSERSPRNRVVSTGVRSSTCLPSREDSVVSCIPVPLPAHPVPNNSFWYGAHRMPVNACAQGGVRGFRRGRA